MADRALQGRLRTLALFILFVFVVLSGRLWQLQIVRGGSFDRMAEENRMRSIPIRAPRGSIYDREGRLLATNRRAYTVSVVPSGFSDPDGRVISRLADLLSMEPEAIREIIRRGGEYPYEPIRIKRDVPIETVIAVEESRSFLPGVLVEAEWVREYPHGSLAGHIIGYLGLTSAADLAAGYRPTDLVGKSGLEQAFEAQLRGTDGSRRVEVNALSRPIREVGTTPPAPGMNLHLTLDLELQRAVEEALVKGLRRVVEEAEEGMAGAGAAVVLDARDGSILAMASHPGLDLARLGGEERGAYVDELNRDPLHPWLNRAIRAYPPGSTFKIVTGAAILEGGALRPDTVYNADGHHKYGKKDWTIHQGLPPAGPVTIVEAMGRSTNDFFWEFALRPQTGGIRAIADWARRFGFGQRIGIALSEPREMAGLVPDPDWKREVYREPWYEAETMDVAIGQGFLEVSPLQLAQAYLTVANRGTMYKPHLVLGVTAYDGQTTLEMRREVKHVQAAPSTWRALIEGLEHVVQWNRGTAYLPFQGAPYDPAGKTGSAQQAGKAAHGWFAGFAPADDPEIVVVVFTEHGESGARAAPIARAIMDAYFGVDGPEL